MTITQYVQMVSDMRAAQQRYFGSRSQVDLLEARRLEREIDRLTTNYLLKHKDE